MEQEQTTLQNKTNISIKYHPNSVFLLNYSRALSFIQFPPFSDGVQKNRYRKGGGGDGELKQLGWSRLMQYPSWKRRYQPFSKFEFSSSSRNVKAVSHKCFASEQYTTTTIALYQICMDGCCSRSSLVEHPSFYFFTLLFNGVSVICLCLSTIQYRCSLYKIKKNVVRFKNLNFRKYNRCLQSKEKLQKTWNVNK